MKKLLTKLSLISTILTPTICADYTCSAFNQPGYNAEICVSPIYGKTQTRQKTVNQSGWVSGLKANADVFSYSNIYVGAELGYKSANLSGKGQPYFVPIYRIEPNRHLGERIMTRFDRPTKSRYRAAWGEIRIGVTGQSVSDATGAITPFAVVGYEQENERFTAPSPFEMSHRTSYGYFGAGFLSKFTVLNDLSVGLNTKFIWMFSARQKTTSRVEIFDKKTPVGSNFNYSVELPIYWAAAGSPAIGLSPFYELTAYNRHKLEKSESEKARISTWGTKICLSWEY